MYASIALSVMPIVVEFGLPMSGAARSVGSDEVRLATRAFRALATGQGAPHSDRVTLTLSRASGSVIPSGFLGLSLEYSALSAYAGDDPAAIDPVFEQLIANLAPGQAPVLRIGGDSTDWSWWPVPGMPRPPGVTNTITEPWIRVTRALAHALGARLILGINLEADNPRLAAAEAKALVDGIGSGSIQALEVGNEPELYDRLGWYWTPDGRGVPGRPPGYGFETFKAQFSETARALPPVPLAGPTMGTLRWMHHWDEFLRDEPRVRLATLHRYGLHSCTPWPASPEYPSASHLLTDTASVAPAIRVGQYVKAAHAMGLPVRIDEMNSAVCNQVPPSVGHSFASALWALTILFEMASVGVDGVNLHNYPGASYEMFTFARTNGRWEGVVRPEYYGALMFAQATPPGSRLVSLLGPAHSSVRAWATRGRDRRIRAVVINDGHHPVAVTLRVSVVHGAASLERLQAPSIAAQQGVTLGGQSFGAQTADGLLTGPPRSGTVLPGRDSYTFRLPGGSAAMLTIPMIATHAAFRQATERVFHPPRRREIRLAR